MSADPGMIERRLRECDALGAVPSSAVLVFAGLLCGLGLSAEVDPINRTVIARWRGCRRELSWVEVETIAIAPERLAAIVRRGFVEVDP